MLKEFAKSFVRELPGLTSFSILTGATMLIVMVVFGEQKSFVFGMGIYGFALGFIPDLRGKRSVVLWGITLAVVFVNMWYFGPRFSFGIVVSLAGQILGISMVARFLEFRKKRLSAG